MRQKNISKIKGKNKKTIYFSIVSISSNMMSVVYYLDVQMIKSESQTLTRI